MHNPTSDQFLHVCLKLSLENKKKINQQVKIIIINRLHVELHQIFFSISILWLAVCCLFRCILGCNQMILHSQICLIINWSLQMKQIEMKWTRKRKKCEETREKLEHINMHNTRGQRFLLLFLSICKNSLG